MSQFITHRQARDLLAWLPNYLKESKISVTMMNLEASESNIKEKLFLRKDKCCCIYSFPGMSFPLGDVYSNIHPYSRKFR